MIIKKGDDKLRWRTCHICNSEEDVIRDNNSTVKIFECWSCWEDYCDTCGDTNNHICNKCLDEAYIMNYGYPYPISKDDLMGIKSAPKHEKEQAKILIENNLYALQDDE